jgi:hypothetical protein
MEPMQTIWLSNGINVANDRNIRIIPEMYRNKWWWVAIQQTLGLIQKCIEINGGWQLDSPNQLVEE